MKPLLIAAAAALGIALTAIGIAAGLRPDDPAATEFLVGLGYFGLLLAPASALAVLILGGIALARTSRRDATANPEALRTTGRG
ncbi:hypothetical protein [Pseudoclavibacter sp. RFBA6]|uniref:hypothetical protein n=1 Tax=Pseudoclavibacter sp. RFBA6 TaxID=2080573 RepID=UPI000CE7FD33|nr:hypothetical protein [Pseudoclavibacter sp. RFBA6]PPG41956.1 hypothetical protein C5C17_02980 [Pseudoclavibacter sp. RFBA6]